MCFHCHWFLPACHRRVKANSIAKHIRECERCPLHWSPQKNLCAILEEHGIRTLGEHPARLAQRFKCEVDLKVYRPVACKREPASQQDPRSGFVRDLTEDGDVEPNPGPSSSCAVMRDQGHVGSSSGHRTKVVSWNCQGSQNLMRALSNDMLWDADITLVQEAGLDAHLCREVAAMAARHGLHSFFKEAQSSVDSLGRPRRRGGLATFVRHQCAARLKKVEGLDGDFEALCVHVGHSLVTNVYRVPSGRPEPYHSFVQEIVSQERRVLLGGDHNLEVHQQGLLAGQVICVRGLDGAPLPSRPGGHRCIDYFVTRDVSAEAVHYHVTLGDHFVVEASFRGLVVSEACRETLWTTKPTTRYHRP